MVFVSLWTSRKLSNICVIVAVFLCLLGAETKTAPLFAAVIVLLLLELLQLAIFYRCPHCGRLLPFRQWATPVYCPYCGRELNTPDPDW